MTDRAPVLVQIISLKGWLSSWSLAANPDVRYY